MPFEQQRAPRPNAGLHRRDLLRGSIAADGPADPAHAQHGARPGLLHTQHDLDRMRRPVPANLTPWISGWNLIANDPSTGSTRRFDELGFSTLTCVR